LYRLGSGRGVFVEFIFEILFQFLAEFLLQIFFQLITELGMRSLADTFRRPKHVILSIIGFTIWGALLGAFSVWIFPDSFIHDAAFREINLIATPVAIGLAMSLVGRLRLRKGQDLELLDRFGYAFTFAFAMAFVRFNWAA